MFDSMVSQLIKSGEDKNNSFDKDQPKSSNYGRKQRLYLLTELSSNRTRVISGGDALSEYLKISKSYIFKLMLGQTTVDRNGYRISHMKRSDLKKYPEFKFDVTRMVFFDEEMNQKYKSLQVRKARFEAKKVELVQNS